MIQLTYHSRARAGTGRTELEEILEVARHHNHLNGLTGFLTFDGERFFQLLEGLEADVDALFERIQGDPRHDDIRLVHRAKGPRLLPTWAMHYELYEKADPFVQETVSRAHRTGEALSAPVVRQLVLALKLQSSVAY